MRALSYAPQLWGQIKVAGLELETARSNAQSAKEAYEAARALQSACYSGEFAGAGAGAGACASLGAENW